jgi:threonine dehydrogenase-like Zn-dependent dehydrogenase
MKPEGKLMRALVYDKKLELQPNYPLHYTANEALIRVTMAGICNTDIEITRGYMKFTGIPGHEFIGIVEKANNTELIGRRITGEINCACHECDYCLNNLSNHCPNRSVLGILNHNGAFADYISVPEENLHIVPDSISDEEAVFIEPLAAAFEIFEQVNISENDMVVVLGDGKLGLLIAQVIALKTKHLTVIGKHHNKLQILDKPGINTIHLNETTDIEADIVIEATGSSSGLSMAIDTVRPKGTIVLKTTIAGYQNINLSKVVVNEITITGSRCGPFKPAIEALASKSVAVLPLISKIYTIDEALEAFEFASKPGVLKVLLKF